MQFMPIYIQLLKGFDYPVLQLKYTKFIKSVGSQVIHRRLVPLFLGLPDRAKLVYVRRVVTKLLSY